MANVQRVIVGISESPAGLAALRYAVNEARRAKAVLMPVRAWTPPADANAYHQYPVPDTLRDYHQIARERIADAFKKAMGGYPSDLFVHSIAPWSPPGRALAELADAPDAILVIGAARRNWLRSLLGTSVRNYCLDRTRCPVISVPPPQPLGELSLRARTFLGVRVRDTSFLMAATRGLRR
ncbi:universal stress protein [Streptomyces kronopolitis]|uniref:universal stress protein n=1 Tax=Streptomyces kronopolitis TaxID=1612435 RepID=UPI0036AE910B